MDMSRRLGGRLIVSSDANKCDVLHAMSAIETLRRRKVREGAVLSYIANGVEITVDAVVEIAHRSGLTRRRSGTVDDLAWNSCNAVGR